MKVHYYIFILALSLFFSCQSSQDKTTNVLIKTPLGDMTVLLYNSTPKHKDNFIKLIKEGVYNEMMFERVIKNFTLQIGNIANNANVDEATKSNYDYTLPEEIGAPHFKGTLAAVRLPDYDNPSRASSSHQFYIVQGTKQSDNSINGAERKKNIRYSDLQRKKYKTIGGLPTLDMDYTVFGEIIEGLEVVDKIAQLPANERDELQKEFPIHIELLN